MSKYTFFYIFIAIVSGVSLQLNWISNASISTTINSTEIIFRIMLAPIPVWILMKFVDYIIYTIVKNNHSIEKAYFKDLYRKGYILFLVPILGMFGIEIPSGSTIIILIFILWVIWSFYRSSNISDKKEFFISTNYIVILFFFSGFSGLIYQIVWQRMLFTFFGVNIESVTTIVVLFMLGIGIGSLVGGKISNTYGDNLPKVFFLIEIGIGVFGALSGYFLDWIGVKTVLLSRLWIVVTVYLFLIFPTLCMGMTLPILVQYLFNHSKNLGKSVSNLYSINTLGSAFACFITSDLLFMYFGLKSSLWIAAFFNLLVGFLAYLYMQNLKNSKA